MTAKKKAAKKPARRPTKKAAAKRPQAPSEAVRAAVYAAECDAQRSACKVPDGDLPADLAEARERRTEINLATTGGTPLTACGGGDPEVVRLEGPWRRRRTAPADPTDEQLPNGSLDHPENTEKE